MFVIGNPKVITVDIDGDFFVGVVEGARNSWTFRSDSPLFLHHFPTGEFSILQVGNDSPQFHKDIATEITKKGFFSFVGR